MLTKIKEVREALKHNLPQCSLALALTLPDICGQVEYPDEKCVGKRYKDWLTNYLPKDAFDSNYDGALTALNQGVDPQFPKLDVNAIYKLRCAFLHSGDAEIENDNEVVQDNYLDEFLLTEIGEMDWTDENDFGVKSGYSSYIERDNQGNEIRTYKIDTKYLCEVLCDTSEAYYKSSIKEEFMKHSVLFVKN